MLLRVFLLVFACLALALRAASGVTAQTSNNFSLKLTGPATARPGEDVTFVLRHTYSTTEPPSQVVYFFDTPQGTTFVSVDNTSGTDFAEALVGSESISPSAPDFAARTSGLSGVTLTFIPRANDGQSTIRLRIADDATGRVVAHAGFRVTDVAGSNEVVTLIESTGLPSTGYANEGRAGWLTAPAVLVLAVVGLLSASLGALARRSGFLTR